MPVFSYRALNREGKSVKGVVDADTARLARRRLRTDGLHPVEIKESHRRSPAGERTGRLGGVIRLRRNPRRLVVEATRQLATLLAAGLPLVTALAAVQEQAEDRDFGRMIALIREEVTQGESFGMVLEKHPEAFSLEYVHLVRAGEIAGALDSVLARLADDLEHRQLRRARISAALAYPAFMTAIGALVLLFLLSFIVPTLTGLFNDLGGALPWPTRLLLLVSGILQRYWWLVIITAAGLSWTVYRLLKKEKYYQRAEVATFRIPVLGLLLKKLKVAKALRGLAIMTSGGAPLTTALTVTARGMGRSLYGAALAEAARMVGQGRSLEDGLAKSGLFPPVIRRMVAVGEAGGALNEMLDRSARAYEEETDRVLTALTALVEPAIILVMGLLVGFVVMAVLLPIFDLSGLVG